MRKLLYPGLWRGCVGAWCPGVSRSRSTILEDFSPNRKHAALNIAASSLWQVNAGRYVYQSNNTNSSYFSYGTVTVPFSLTAWSAAPLSGTTNVIGLFNGNFNGWYISIDSTSVAAVRVLNNNFTGSAICVSSITRTMSSSTLVQVTMIAFADGNVQIFADGKAGVASTNGGTLPTLTGHRITLGCGWVSPTAISQFDDIAVYDRPVNPNEIGLLSRRRGIAYETMPTRYHTRGATGGGGVTGTVTATLAGVTGLATATSPSKGTLSTTLSGVTSSSQGSATIKVAVSSVLDGVSVASTSTSKISGIASTTLGGVSVASSSTSKISGLANTTLGGVSVLATGASKVSGSTSVTLSGVSVASSGSQNIVSYGTLAITLGGVSVSSSATSKISGTGASTLAGVTVTTTATSKITGSSTSTLEGVTVASVGTGVVSYTADLDLFPDVLFPDSLFAF